MARLYKCYGTCYEKHLLENMRVIGATRFCEPCADKKEISDRERQELYSLIKMYYKIPFPTGQMLKQIKNFVEERQYTYRGIILTMKYAFEVERSYSPVVKYGLSLIPYKYESAKDFYVRQQKQAQSVMSSAGNIEAVERKVSKAVIETEPETIKSVDMEDLL